MSLAVWTHCGTVDGPDGGRRGPSGNFYFIGMLTFCLVLSANIWPEEVIWNFCALDFCLLLTEELSREYKNVSCFPFSGHCVCKHTCWWSHFKTKHNLEYLESSFQLRKLLALDVWMFPFIPLQHYHCNQKHGFFSRENLWYAATKQDFQVKIFCEIAGLGKTGSLCIVPQAHFPATEKGKAELK